MHDIFNRLKAFLAGLKTSWRAHAVLASVEGEYFISILSNDFFLILPVVFLRFKYFHCMKKLKTYWLFLCTPTFAPAEGKHCKQNRCQYIIICSVLPLWRGYKEIKLHQILNRQSCPDVLRSLILK